MMPKRKLEDLLKAKDRGRLAGPTRQPASISADPEGPKKSNENKAQEQQEELSKRLKRAKQPRKPIDVSKELSTLKYSTRDNKNLPKLPSNVTILKRPINHGPIASPFAGSGVPKVVYVSRKTPVISAVKRVKQFLREIEKRAMQSIGVDGVLNRASSGRNGDRELQSKLEEVSEKLNRDAEEVLVKASGRALDQALRVADWFRKREEDISCKVEVRTGKVSVIDDIVGLEKVDKEMNSGDTQDEKEEKENQTSTMLELGDTTMELLGTLQGQGKTLARRNEEEEDVGLEAHDKGSEAISKAKRKRKRRKEYDPDDIPEARLRWVKTIEVAISLKA